MGSRLLVESSRPIRSGGLVRTPRPVLTSPLIVLQRSAGNRAVAELVQRGAPAVPVVQRDPLTKEEFEQIRELAANIMGTYPPRDYYYVGLGKSPTPLIAFLQASQVPAINLPLSKFSPALPGVTPSRDSGRGPALTGAQQQELTTHFDRFLPSQATLNGRAILLIDLSLSGRSLIATREYMQRYLQAKYGRSWLGQLLCSCLTPEPPVPEVVPLALLTPGMMRPGGMERSLTAGRGDPDRIEGMDIPGDVSQGDSLAGRMGAEQYKPRAEFPGDFKITSGHKSSGIVSSSAGAKDEYAALKAEIQEFLREDAPLIHLVDDGLVGAIKEVGDRIPLLMGEL